MLNRVQNQEKSVDCFLPGVDQTNRKSLLELFGKLKLLNVINTRTDDQQNL